ncbi:Uncharacterised protein [Candidatus Bilamarchaeum dharawalense]|uniref:Tetratricopeptide repeat protein n=1 Tax=Candidatus Bilamarchaeum dharawalense TaxID=2885759 RepID=A0A5E4LMY3_9ARCH|nr:Uncharacterised protein [Candidatus Bilamarchaeum dharawalense]
MKQVAYQKQLVCYLQSQSNEQAYTFAKQYVNEYPDDMIAHFLLAKSALAFGNFAEATIEARKAFNLSKNEADMIMCVIHACVAYYKLGEYAKGFELLKSTENIRTCEETEQLFFLFSLLVDNDREAERHFNSMFATDNIAAKEFVTSVAEGGAIDFEKIFKKVDRISY